MTNIQRNKRKQQASAGQHTGMAAKVIINARQNSFKFSDRVLSLDSPVTIGRTGGNASSGSDNAYFDSKVSMVKVYSLNLNEISLFWKF